MRCQKQGQRCHILSNFYPLWGMLLSERAIGQIFRLFQKPGLHPVSQTLRDAEKNH
ncbi:MAG: hypothetical protein ABI262_26540 [Microcoleus sp.]